MPRSAIINVMTQSVIKASRLLIRDFGEVQNLQASVKEPIEYIDKAKKRSENIIIKELQKARPDYSLLPKNTNEIIGKNIQQRFIIDPLNGLKNFLHGFPFFTISIALEREGKIVAGVIYNPIMDELFTAEKGNGAFLNDRRLRVSNRRKLSESIIGIGISNSSFRDNDFYLKKLKNIINEVSEVRRIGISTLDLAYVAAGRFDGIWMHDLSLWDSSGALLIQESGGFFSKIAIEEKNFVSGNEIIYRSLIKILKE